MLNATAEGPYPEDVTTPSALSRVWGASLESPVSPALSKGCGVHGFCSRPIIGQPPGTDTSTEEVRLELLAGTFGEDTARDELLTV